MCHWDEIQTGRGYFSSVSSVHQLKWMFVEILTGGVCFAFPDLRVASSFIAIKFYQCFINNIWVKTFLALNATRWWCFVNSCFHGHCALSWWPLDKKRSSFCLYRNDSLIRGMCLHQVSSSFRHVNVCEEVSMQKLQTSKAFKITVESLIR